MLLFSQPGPHNTNAAAVEGIRKAKQLNTDLVFASSSGTTARIVIAEARKQGFTGKLIDVRSVSDAQARGLNRMNAETKRELEDQGVVIVTAGHALSSGERGLSRQFSGVYPLEIMAATLRTLGQGVKVCFECAVMALDADVITIETSRSDMELLESFEAFEYPNEIGPGVYDIHSPNVPSVEWIEALLKKAAQRIPVERLWVNPDCGLKTRGWPETRAALANMVQAAQNLRESA